MGGRERGTSCHPPASSRDVGPPKLGPVRSPALAGRRRLPGVVGVVDLLPPPRHAVGRPPPPREATRSSASMRTGIGCVAGVVEHLPLRAGVDHGLALAVALQEEGRAAAELRHRSLAAPVPDERREHVAAGAQVRREVERLVAPVHQVRALRTRRHLLPVHEEPVAVVGRHVDHEPVGPSREVERAAEVEDAERVCRARPAATPRAPPARRRRRSAPAAGLRCVRPLRRRTPASGPRRRRAKAEPDGPLLDRSRQGFERLSQSTRLKPPLETDVAR